MAERSRGSVTLGHAVRRGVQRFTRARLAYGHGLTNARDEAIYLALHALGLPPDHYDPQRTLKNSELNQILNLYTQRVRTRKPAAYLTHEAWLGESRFYVDERVIVPRSFIAELLNHDDGLWLPPPGRVRRALDLCTGSGCLAILLAKYYSRSRIDAADLSTDALAVAQRNVADYRLQRRIALIESDYFSALRDRQYDLIISNPPYVRAAVMRKLPAEYRREPALALAGGRDGLDAVRVILAHAARHLNPDGVLIVETGHARAAVERAWPRLPFTWPLTSGGDDCVFVLSAADLRQAQPALPAPATARSGAPRQRTIRRTARA